MALIGAHLLAGELASAPDHGSAFAAYEERMRPIVDRAQKLAPGVPGIASPTSRLGVLILRTVVRVVATAPVRALTARLPASSERTGPTIPEYPRCR